MFTITIKVESNNSEVYDEVYNAASKILADNHTLTGEQYNLRGSFSSGSIT